MEDDGIQILELPGEKNSGYQPGTFLSKVKFFKDDGHLQFQPDDFYAGRTVTINGYTFTITNAAEKTLEFMESRSDIWLSTDLDKIVAKLGEYAEDVKVAVENDTECNNGVVDAVTVHKYIEEAQAPLVLQETITLLRYLSRSAVFGTGGGGKDKTTSTTSATTTTADGSSMVSQSIRLSQLVEFLDSLSCN
jgi:hypothetical protein